ncbi:MAG TPA: PilZ domain-containing protein [Thermoanaerobaculia bacterium]|jgi:hypothetical protein
MTAAMVDDDRRRFQRLKLAKPILGTMDDANILILDIGIGGAQIEHYGEVSPGQRFTISFRWQSEDVQFVSEIARTEIVRQPGGDAKSVVSHTGVRFVEPIGDSETRLQDLLTSFVGKVLLAQRANASGDAREQGMVLEQLGEARRKRRRGYVSYRLIGGKWWRVPTESATQPADGFTVAAYEDEEELETLCRTYEAADDEGRRLIRLVSELSARAVTRP